MEVRDETVMGREVTLTCANLVMPLLKRAATTQVIDAGGNGVMAIPRGHRFGIEFANAFPQGLVLVGVIAPDTEYQTREERAAGRPVRQKSDEVTGKRQWKATVTDPDEPNAKRASFEVTFLADVQPVPTTAEALPGTMAMS